MIVTLLIVAWMQIGLAVVCAHSDWLRERTIKEIEAHDIPVTRLSIGLNMMVYGIAWPMVLALEHTDKPKAFPVWLEWVRQTSDDVDKWELVWLLCDSVSHERLGEVIVEREITAEEASEKIHQYNTTGPVTRRVDEAA